MNRKGIAGALAVVMLLASSAAFAGGAGEKQTGPVNVVFWSALSGAAGDLQAEQVKAFNASQKDVVADAQFQGAYAEVVQKLIAAMAAGNVPDMVLLDSPFVALFAKDSALVSLDRFAADPKQGVDLKAFIPGLIADGYYKGKLYALPLVRSTPLLYFNRDLFKELGLPDRVPDTWDEFREFSKKMTKADRYGAAFEMGVTTAHWYLQGLIYSWGGQISDEDFNILLESPEAIAAAQFWQDMVFKDKIAIPGIPSAQAEYLNGRVGLVFGSTGSMANLMGKATFKVGMGFMPGKVKHQVPVGGSLIAMTSSNKNRQLGSWEFMKFLTNPANNAAVVVKTGYMPTRQATLNEPDLKAYFEKYPDRRIAIDQLQYARPQASVISLGKGTEILRQAVEKLLVGQVPAAQVMKEAAVDLKKEYVESFK